MMSIEQGPGPKRISSLPEIEGDLTIAKIFVRELRGKIAKAPGGSRERSLAITKLEEAEMWLDKAELAEI